MRQSSRILFDAGVVRLSDEESIVLAEHWQHDRKFFSTAEHELLTYNLHEQYPAYSPTPRKSSCQQPWPYLYAAT